MIHLIQTAGVWAMSNDETKTPADADSQKPEEQEQEKDQDKTLFYELLAEIRF